MDDFFRKILNLRNPNEEVDSIIKETIKNYFQEYEDISEGMCFIHTTNLKDMLDKQHIKTYQLNSNNLGSNFEHFFLLVDNIEELYLIDPTYSQFDSTNKTLITKNLKSFPTDTLIATEKGNILYEALISQKYSKVDIEDISLYLGSLETNKINNISDLIMRSK